MGGRVVFGAALAALLFLGPAAAQGGLPRAVTLDEAIRRSEAVQPAMIAAHGQTASAGLRLRSARGAYLPNLSFSSNGSTSYSTGPSRVDPTTGQIISGNSSNTSVSLSFSSGVELFDGFRRRHEMQAARANETQIDAALVNTRFQNTLTTTNAFFDALAAGQVLRVREASVKRAEQQLQEAEARLRNGSASRSDSLRSVVTLGNAQLSLLQAQNTMANAEATLGRLVGAEERVSAIDDSSYYNFATTLDTAQIRREALLASPQLQIAEAQVAAARAAHAGSRSTLYPSLNLSLGSSWSGSAANDFMLRGNRSLGLGLSWTIFNRFSREQSIAQAQIAVDNAEANAADARRQIAAAVTQRLADLTTATEQMRITVISLTAAEEELRVVTDRYRFAAATIIELLSSEEQLTQAEVDVVSARYTWLRAKAQLEALMGRSL